jgi:hypothetical protein
MVVCEKNSSLVTTTMWTLTSTDEPMGNATSNSTLFDMVERQLQAGEE